MEQMRALMIGKKNKKKKNRYQIAMVHQIYVRPPQGFRLTTHWRRSSLPKEIRKFFTSDIPDANFS